MKKLFLVCLMSFIGLGVCSAQQATKKKVTTVVFATDVECESCVAKIMNNVPSLGKGVKDVKTNIETKEVTVVFDASKNDVGHIVKGLESLKVQATPKTIDGKAVTCCKADQCAAAKECKGKASAEATCCDKGACAAEK